MAIFHCTIGNVSRAKGSSTCASAAYITGMKIFEERTGNTYDYARKQRVFDFSTVGLDYVILPEGVSKDEFGTVEKLANSIENFEKKDDARPAKREEFSLPVEASREEKIKIALAHINDTWVSKGYAVVWAIHDIDGHNPHVHVLVLNRRMNQKGEFEKTKTKTTYELDENGKKIPVYETQRDSAGKILKDKDGKRVLKLDSDGNPIVSKDKNGKTIYKRIKVEESCLDRKELIAEARKNLEVHINEILSPELQVDCRSLQSQGIDRIPTVHEGFAARGMEARGQVSERCELNRNIEAENAKNMIAQLRAKIEALGARLVAAMDKLLTHHEEQGVQTANVDHYKPHEYDPNYNYVEDPEAILSATSTNPLIKELIQSRSYDLTENNLKSVAEVADFLETNHIRSYAEFRQAYADLTESINGNLKTYNLSAEQLSIAREKLKHRKNIDKNKKVYENYTEVAGKKNPIDRALAKNYQKDHENEISEYRVAQKYLRAHASKNKKMPSVQQIKDEIDSLKTKCKKIGDEFRTERIKGFDMFKIYKNIEAIIGPDPDRPDWHPTNTLDYRTEHALPKRLQIYRGHEYNSIYNPTQEQEIQAQKRERKKVIKKEGPSL